jgi:hypothetical protein
VSFNPLERDAMRQILVLTVVFFALPVLTRAQADVYISYQGRLFADGSPLEGFHDVQCGIYGTPDDPADLWNETHFGVAFVDGVFEVLLGAETPLPHSIFSGDSRYLGVAVDGSEELTPRFLLNDVPGAAFSYSVHGDVETTPGSLIINNAGGEKMIEMVSTEGAAGASYRALSTSESAGRSDAAESTLNPNPSFTNRALIRLFNPQPEPPARMLEFVVDDVDGPQVRAFDVFGPVLGLEPAPLGIGYRVKLQDPNDQGTLLELRSEYSDAKAGHVSVFNKDFDRASHLDGGNLSLQWQALTGEVTPIVLSTSSDGASVAIGTDTPIEALTVMGNGWFSGEVFAVSPTLVKEEIAPIGNALELVAKMNGYFYDYRNSEFPELDMPRGRRIGFLAEEVKDVLPEAVGENELGLTGVSYSRVTALLVEAVKELQVENERLRSRLDRLEEQSPLR